ncbi:hypothetical protein KVR01_011576 [Diaporthe batatas]|uniref:uncharacterized protein n=1 Tax=Diaporthe batatas TaxID=748121 RepID=UPI001D04E338|nr:uncharacterized protein KVR01_011576 [Diaporthe batatas]KAG8158454.1 hypothetical protein KVR01_011576 [Diaporthe batatas]
MGFFNHCEPNRRFNSYTGETFPRGPTTWHTIDWDQRRYISTTVREEVDFVDGADEVEERVIQSLSKMVDQLSADVLVVNFSIEGDLISTSSDTKYDTAAIPLYSPVDMIPEKYRDGYVSRSDLIEVDRLSPCVDLVTYRDQHGSRAVFKYQFHHDQALRNWHEMNCWMRLSGHPNIVPFDRIVTDHQEVPSHGPVHVVVGFTSVFVPGSTLQDNPSRLCKLKHLEQLLKVVDDLNLKFGIVHHDLAPRNVLIDPSTDTLQLFDFSSSARLGWRGESKGQVIFTNVGTFKADLKGVIATIYEVITQDTKLAEQILQGADISTLQEKEWIKHPDINLDADVTHYRQRLDRWLQWRNQPENLISHYTQAPSYIEWPQPWRPEMPFLDQEGNLIGESMPSTCMSRAAQRALGLKFVEWERPAHNKIPPGFCVLGDGRLVMQTELDGNV